MDRIAWVSDTFLASSVIPLNQKFHLLPLHCFFPTGELVHQCPVLHNALHVREDHTVPVQIAMLPICAWLTELPETQFLGTKRNNGQIAG